MYIRQRGRVVRALWTCYPEGVSKMRGQVGAGAGAGVYLV